MVCMAGFNFFDIGSFVGFILFLLILLMWVGVLLGFIGGGIKMIIFGIVLFNIW